DGDGERKEVGCRDGGGSHRFSYNALPGADGMAMQRYDVAVVGVGIVGASAVHALARAGARVIALDAAAPGAGTSGTSFAWVNAVSKEPEVYHRLNTARMAMHRELARALGQDGGDHAPR